MATIYTVSQLNNEIKDLLDAVPGYRNLLVQGEISNYKAHSSGHHYMTLKDKDAAINAVMFRSDAMRLKFRLENGMKVIVRARVSSFPRTGAVQLYISEIIPDGAGALNVAFEQLKAKLAAQGLFAPEHKKPLPPFPGIIGIVTSSAGAAVHDMLRILNKRYPLTQVRLFPVRVQGVEAPGEIAAAIRYANHYQLADLLIVGRGGGSIEDLWAFNDERVAYAIYESRIPIISAVGHEPDVTISDYVADLRAATPSNAAELAVPDQAALLQNMDAAASAMASALSGKLRHARQRLNVLSQSPALSSPTSYMEQRRQSLEHLKTRLIAAENQQIQRKKQRFIGSTAKLDAMSPLKVLTRGYSIVHGDNDAVLRSVHQTAPGHEVRITLSDGSLKAVVSEIKEDTK